MQKGSKQTQKTITQMTKSKLKWWKEKGIERTLWICPTCGKEKMLTQAEKELKKYCSVKCKPFDEYISGKKKNYSGNGLSINIHKKIVTLCGKASKYQCVGDGINPCDNQARDWSNDDHEYSLDPDNYKPRCKSCHMKYDYTFNNRIKAWSKTKNVFNTAKLILN